MVWKNSCSTGFLLVEVLLALTLFSILLIGLSQTLLLTNESQSIIASRTKAISIAEGGLEGVRSVRDENYLLLVAGNYGVRPKAGNDGYELHVGPDIIDKYSREIEIIEDGARARIIRSVVTWSDNSRRQNEVVLESRLTQWQRPVSNSPIRVTTYEIEEGFDDNELGLELRQDLEENYFVMITGASNNATSRPPRQDGVRVNGDPHGNFSLVTNDNVIQLRRGDDTDSWQGVVVVVEALEDFNGSGFELIDVEETALASGSINTNQYEFDFLSQNYNSNMVPYGGLRGGGIEITDNSNDSDEYGVSLGTEVFFGAEFGYNNLLFVARYGGSNRSLESAIVTTYVVEWGNDWDIEELIFRSWDAGGNGADQVNDYQSFTLNQSYDRDKTWVWASTGISDGDGLGDGPLGKLVTLGNGVVQNTSENTVSWGSEYSANRRDTAYIHSHPSLLVEYRFKADGDSGGGSGFQEIVVGGFNSPTLTEYYSSGSTMNFTGVLSIAGVNGSDGLIPSFFGPAPITGNLMNLVSDEDQILDSERNHATEEIAYWVFDSTNENIVDRNGDAIGEIGTVSSSGTSPVTIDFSMTYTDPIIVANYVLPDAVSPPAVVRVDNLSSTSVQLNAQNPGNLTTPTNSTINYIVIESGNHTLEGNVRLRAGKVNSTTTTLSPVWSTGTQIDVTPSPRINNPVVIGQVMTSNDSDWSQFWASSDNGDDPPERNDIFIGKHVGQDSSNSTRSNELLGYIILESGTGTMDNGLNWDAGITSDTIQGPDDSPPYTQTLSFPSNPVVYSTFGSNRFIQSFETSNGTGQAYSRPVWAPRFESPNEVTTERQYSGQNNVMWFQAVDFGNL